MEALNWPKNRPFPLCAFQKCEFLGNARALSFPIDWPEPFGLVMIEAMSAGTPVIAWPTGSVPEVITEGVSGRMVNSIEAAVVAAQQATYMDRRKVRAEFEKRFTAARMARTYVAAYRSLLARVPANTAYAQREVSPLAWERLAKQGGGQVLNRRVEAINPRRNPKPACAGDNSGMPATGCTAAKRSLGGERTSVMTLKRRRAV